MPVVTIRVRGFDQATASINRLMLWKAGLHRPLGRLMKRQHEHRVEHEKKDDRGRHWEPLRPYTIAKKERQGHPHPEDILIDSRRMLGSFQIDVRGDLIRLRNPSRYTIFHQYGTRYMVARPFLGLSKPNITEIKRLVTRHVSSLLRGGSRGNR